uniref:exodeoxyribonuclease VII large subunit n=1 Tax=Anaerococcus mediterraneensis TaxID=1870984 RepID=UPI000930C51E|nr:exodeoxyribonuclease VII large subunit [Anaerococcus mediterraneensis]
MRKPLSVKQFNEYIKSNIKHDPIFQRVYIKGELANIRFNNSHLYFSLKEDLEIIDCVIYYYEDKDINFEFNPGQEIMLRGNLYFNNYSSRLVIVASEVTDVGLSEKYKEFLLMKEDLRSNGYFDIEKKKTIDRLAKRIGLITSKDGAALVDFLAMINTKPNDIHIYFSPVKVQGEQSINQISRAIKNLDDMNLDLIVITRGGGSNEDLSTFNERKILDACFYAKTPIVSAVGHNIDTNLIDYVSDLSLQTPTEAGSFIISLYDDYKKKIDDKFKEALLTINKSIDINEIKLDSLGSRIGFLNPKNNIEQKLSDLELLMEKISASVSKNLEYRKIKLDSVKLKLDMVQKLIELNKDIISIKKDGTKVYSKHSLSRGDLLKIGFSDGDVLVEVVG